MEKRATVIDSIKNSDSNVILVDAGDVFGAGLNPRRHKFIAQAYKYLDYDVWTPGEQDFIEGKNTFMNELLPAFKVTLNTNLKVEDKKFGQPYLIKEIDGVKLGFTATIKKDVAKYISPIHKMQSSIEDQNKTLDPVIEELKDKCDIIILVSHSGHDTDIEFAKKYNDVDIIIGAHSQTLIKDSMPVYDTYIVQAGKSGYRVGVLKLKIDKLKITNVDNKLILLNKNIKNHPEIMKIIDKYRKKVRY